MPLPTEASKLVLPTKDVQLPITKDADGAPVVVRIRKLNRTELLVLMGGFPMLATETPEQAEERRAKATKNPLDPEVMQHVMNSITLGRKIVVTSAVDPKFCMPGEQNGSGAVDISILDDDDTAVLCDETLKLSDWGGGEVEKDTSLARFPARKSRRRARS